MNGTTIKVILEKHGMPFVGLKTAMMHCDVHPWSACTMVTCSTLIGYVLLNHQWKSGCAVSPYIDTFHTSHLV